VGEHEVEVAAHEVVQLVALGCISSWSAVPSTSYCVTSHPSAATRWATTGSVAAPLMTWSQKSATGISIRRASVPSTYQ